MKNFFAPLRLADKFILIFVFLLGCMSLLMLESTVYDEGFVLDRVVWGASSGIRAWICGHDDGTPSRLHHVHRLQQAPVHRVHIDSSSGLYTGSWPRAIRLKGVDKFRGNYSAAVRIRQDTFHSADGQPICPITEKTSKNSAECCSQVCMRFLSSP